eukprot:SAG31_NODE_2093_length_6459_cov_3.398585_2_plen_53_part_00
MPGHAMATRIRRVRARAQCAAWAAAGAKQLDRLLSSNRLARQAGSILSIGHS